MAVLTAATTESLIFNSQDISYNSELRSKEMIQAISEIV
jgi:hypothetical protein